MKGWGLRKFENKKIIVPLLNYSVSFLKITRCDVISYGKGLQPGVFLCADRNERVNF